MMIAGRWETINPLDTALPRGVGSLLLVVADLRFSGTLRELVAGVCSRAGIAQSRECIAAP